MKQVSSILIEKTQVSPAKKARKSPANKTGSNKQSPNFKFGKAHDEISQIKKSLENCLEKVHRLEKKFSQTDREFLSKLSKRSDLPKDVASELKKHLKK